MPEPTHVESDLHCIRCGHNLRTLAWAAKCGECGAAVELSRVPDILGIDDLRSIRWMRLGLALLVVGVLVDLFVVSSWYVSLIDWLSVDREWQLESYAKHGQCLVWAAATFVFLVVSLRIRMKWFYLVFLCASFTFRLAFHASFYLFAERLFLYSNARGIGWDTIQVAYVTLAVLDMAARPLVLVCAIAAINKVLGERERRANHELMSISVTVLVLTAVINLEMALGDLGVLRMANVPRIVVWICDFLVIFVAVSLLIVRHRLPRVRIPGESTQPIQISSIESR